MATERIVVDPITRIEGHLRVELEVADGLIANAWSQTTQFRGIETICEGRDPRDVWAFVGRICGVCTGTHSVASVVAVESAIGCDIPKQAQLIRDLVLASQEIHDHVVHFYHLHALDWVNVVSAAKADPQKTAEFARSIGSTWKGNTPEQFAKVKETIKGVLAAGQLSIFTGGYWDHADYRLPPEANLMAVSHYLDALQFQRSIIRINTVFGGKNPHPNFLVGGMACSIDPDKSETVNQVHLDQIKNWVAEIEDFVSGCYLPDALAIMKVYSDYFDIGKSADTFLAVGMAGAMIRSDQLDRSISYNHPEIVPSVILDGDYTTVHPLDTAKIKEYISSAWYDYSVGKDQGLAPEIGETTPAYTGPKPPYTWLADNTEYSWSKSPRYDGRSVQVGPLARVLVAYIQNDVATKKIVNDAMKHLGIGIEQLNSTGGRTLARAVEAATTAEALSTVLLPTFIQGLKEGDFDVFNATTWEPESWPNPTQGFALMEVARGTLAHYVTINNGKTERYQAVVPTTWLAGGRDPKGQLGPYEAALANGRHPLANPKQPLEVLRTIHSFDPCMSCAVHLFNPEGDELIKVMTQ